LYFGGCFFDQPLTASSDYRVAVLTIYVLAAKTLMGIGLPPKQLGADAGLTVMLNIDL
jgi:hypothetical protein